MRDVLRLLDKIVADRGAGADRGRDGHGQGADRPRDPREGPAREAAFVSENCAALPETLLESELFGHVRGAFTGADRDKKGLFELADKGTLFLDEIGDMSPDMQTKLLRVLQEGEIRPVGGKTVRKVDVRIICASATRTSSGSCEAGEFREDLYYRLKVLTIQLPPLRERSEDIPLLVEHFLALARARRASARRRSAPGVMERLTAYDWPGNIRELENEVKRMLALGEDVDHRRRPLGAGPPRRPRRARRGARRRRPSRTSSTLVERVERREIEKALRRAEGNKTRASDLLGISRFTLQRKLEKYGMEAAGHDGE